MGPADVAHGSSSAGVSHGNCTPSQVLYSLTGTANSCPQRLSQIIPRA